MTEMTHESIHEEIHMPGPSFWPLVLAFGMLVFAAGMISKDLRLAIAPVGAAILAAGIAGWLTGNIRERIHGPTLAGDSKLAIWMFLGSEVLFFTGLIATFLLIRARAPADVAHVLNIPLTALNTFVLLTSSLTAVMAHDSAVKGNRSRLILFLALTAVLGAVFVSVQGFEYTRLYAEGLQWTNIPYGTAFFTLTGFHGTHVIVGIIWCLAVLGGAVRGVFDKGHYGGVENFGLYWHFVDVVWILLFTLIYLMQ